MRSIAYRRAQRERIKRKRIRERYWDGHYHPMSIDTPKPCSCWMCGNPRRYFKEKRHDELRQPDIDDEFDDYMWIEDSKNDLYLLWREYEYGRFS